MFKRKLKVLYNFFQLNSPIKYLCSALFVNVQNTITTSAKLKIKSFVCLKLNIYKNFL